MVMKVKNYSTPYLIPANQLVDGECGIVRDSLMDKNGCLIQRVNKGKADMLVYVNSSQWWSDIPRATFLVERVIPGMEFTL